MERSIEGGDDQLGSSSLNDVFAVLAESNRRKVLRYLRTTDGPATVLELATHLAADQPVDGRTTAEIRLYHQHLPKLASNGFVTVDGEVVSLTDRGRAAAAIQRLVVQAVAGEATSLPSVEPVPGASFSDALLDPDAVGEPDSSADGC